MKVLCATVIFTTGLLIKAALGLWCLECDDVPASRDCAYVRECGPHGICYQELVVSTSGHVGRRMGCRSRANCGLAPQGKRDVSKRDVSKRSFGEVIPCSQCCDTDLCQPTLCHDKPYGNNGPVCFHCDLQQGGDCNTITQCDIDEVCTISIGSGPDGRDKLLASQCMGAAACQKISTALMGRRRTIYNDQQCFHCCGQNLCNANCTGPATTTPRPTTQAPTRPPAFTRAPCKDSLSTDTCLQVQQFVCKNITMATNAGCLHTCKFC